MASGQSRQVSRVSKRDRAEVFGKAKSLVYAGIYALRQGIGSGLDEGLPQGELRDRARKSSLDLDSPARILLSFMRNAQTVDHAEEMPTRLWVRERLVTLLGEICGLSENEIRDDSTIDRELEMESVQMVELQVALEQEFDVTIDFLEVLRLNSFRRITDYIHQLTVEHAAAS